MYYRIEIVQHHFKEHKKFYIGVGAGIALAGITAPIVRGVFHLPISRGISVTADRSIAVVGKKVVMNNVSCISANRQGPPSWVVRCKETGAIFTSQRSAAMEMGLHQDELSSHLNGRRDHVRGNHFERICMAA